MERPLVVKTEELVEVAGTEVQELFQMVVVMMIKVAEVEVVIHTLPLLLLIILQVAYSMLHIT